LGVLFLPGKAYCAKAPIYYGLTARL
jgi:hypothetical protein